MNRNAIARIIIYSIIIVILLIALIIGLSVNLFSFGIGTGHSEVYEGETSFNGGMLPLPADEIDSISIDWASGNISIAPADVDSIQVSEDAAGSSKYQMVVKQSGSTLKIQFCESGWKTGFNLSIPHKALTILVPRDWECNTLEIDAAATAVCVNDMTIRNVDIDSASGDCTFTNCNVKTIDMDSASGGLVFSGTLEEADFDGASANAELVLSAAPKTVKMDSVSGTLDLTLPEGAGFTLKKETLSGSFSCDFPTESKGDRIIFGDGSARIEMNGVSGSIRIHKGN